MLHYLKKIFLNPLKNKKHHDFSTDKLSPRTANILQRKAALFDEGDLLQTCTPPFWILAESLDAEEMQIFEATVFYLCRIASVRPNTRAEIEQILQNYANTHTDQAERLQIINRYKAENAPCA